MTEREDVRAVIRQACAPWLWRAADVSPMTDAVLTAIEAAGYALVERASLRDPAYFEPAVDPTNTLPTVERKRRAEALWKAHIYRLSLSPLPEPGE